MGYNYYVYIHIMSVFCKMPEETCDSFILGVPVTSTNRIEWELIMTTPISWELFTTFP